MNASGLQLIALHSRASSRSTRSFRPQLAGCLICCNIPPETSVPFKTRPLRRHSRKRAWCCIGYFASARSFIRNAPIPFGRPRIPSKQPCMYVERRKGNVQHRPGIHNPLHTVKFLSSPPSYRWQFRNLTWASSNPFSRRFLSFRTYSRGGYQRYDNIMS